MKSLVARILVVGTALAGAVAVNAQDKTITATVPFSFYMGSTVMPLGAYRVDEVAHGQIVSLRAPEAHAAKAITAHEVAGKSLDEPPRLVFHRYGNTYFLSEIWAGNGSVGHALVRSKAEKEIARSGSPTLAVIKLALH